MLAAAAAFVTPALGSLAAPLQLIRGIGESKSKSEEDAIVGKLVELSKQKIREGRREPRSQKELLVYLIYIEMLGHDTAWAQATAIQLCSDKNLAVKKVGRGRLPLPASPHPSTHLFAHCLLPRLTVTQCSSLLQLAYLTVSLLLDPASELSIMVVATIQADLRSDNFLTGVSTSGPLHLAISSLQDTLRYRLHCSQY